MSFSKQIGDFRTKTVSNAKLVIDKTATDLFGAVIEDTPVDTGNAKKGWSQRQIHDGHELANNVEYIKSLENGHSKQAPHGMVRKNVRRHEQILKEATGQIKK